MDVYCTEMCVEMMDFTLGNIVQYHCNIILLVVISNFTY